MTVRLVLRYLQRRGGEGYSRPPEAVLVGRGLLHRAAKVKFAPEVLAPAAPHPEAHGPVSGERGFRRHARRWSAPARARTFLERAYDDFVTSSPLKERVFKVLKDHDPSRPVKPGAAFVDFDEILNPIEK